MTDTIVYECSQGVARLVLNNPDRHNSLGEEQLMAIQGRLSALAADEDVRVLVITGAGGRTFCAGAALQEMQTGQISGDLFQETTDMIAGLAIPTIAAINGNVFGGGVELALSCDFRIGIDEARMRVPAAKIGLCYPVSGIERFVQRLGISAAKRLLMAAEELRGQEMREIGFLDYQVPTLRFESSVAELAANLSGLAPLAVKAMKSIIQQSAAGQLDREAAAQLSDRCQASSDLLEGFAAQREKRSPVFKGR